MYGQPGDCPMLRTSPAGLELIKGHEQLRLVAYLCPAGVPTIGWGHTGPDVTEGDVRRGRKISELQAVDLLRSDLQDAEHTVRQLVKKPLAQHQFDALVSFVFNVGRGNFGKSTLLRLLNAGNYAAVPEQLARWNRGGGRVLNGLIRRRADEAALWSGVTAGEDAAENATPDNVETLGAKVRRMIGAA